MTRVPWRWRKVWDSLSEATRCEKTYRLLMPARTTVAASNETSSSTRVNPRLPISDYPSVVGGVLGDHRHQRHGIRLLERRRHRHGDPFGLVGAGAAPRASHAARRVRRVVVVHKVDTRRPREILAGGTTRCAGCGSYLHARLEVRLRAGPHWKNIIEPSRRVLERERCQAFELLLGEVEGDVSVALPHDGRLRPAEHETDTDDGDPQDDRSKQHFEKGHAVLVKPFASRLHLPASMRIDHAR